MPEQTPDTEGNEDEPEIELQDPDDYHERQRLKEIHQARRNVTEKVDNLDISEEKVGAISYNSIQELAHATAMYVNEILPILEHTDTDEDQIGLSEDHSHDTIIEFAVTMGMKTDNQKPAKPTHSMAVYRKCNSILADVKPLIEEDDTDEWEV